MTYNFSLDSITQARQLELAMVEAANLHCLSYDRSQALAAAVVERLGESWMLIAFTFESDRSTGGCYQQIIDQQWGWVFRDIIRDEQSGGQPTESTIAPTSP